MWSIFLKIPRFVDKKQSITLYISENSKAQHEPKFYNKHITENFKAHHEIQYFNNQILENSKAQHEIKYCKTLLISRTSR